MALKALCGLVICCHSSVLMTGIKVPLWDLGSVSLCGITARIWAVIALDRHSCLFTPAIWSGCWFFAASQPSIQWQTLLQCECASVDSRSTINHRHAVEFILRVGFKSLSSDFIGSKPIDSSWSRLCSLRHSHGFFSSSVFGFIGMEPINLSAWNWIKADPFLSPSACRIQPKSSS